MLNTKDNIPSYYVAIGASAGGLEAIEKFFNNMPDDTGMAFIVIQHLSPDYKSLMVELLSKHTKMPVNRAEDGMSVLKNTVYLIPPKNNLTIYHGKLLLSERTDRQSLNLPIDIFFSSLAKDQGEKSIAVVLSGTASDGTRGVKAVKEANGIVVAQEESSAQFDAMPKNAISTGSVDLILRPEEMAEELLNYIKNPYVSKEKRAGAQDGVDKLLSMVRDKTSVDFSHYKPSTVLRRIERRIAVNQMNSLGDYLEYLESNPNEVTSLYKDILIGVTSFFRDKNAFDELKNKIIPDLIRTSNIKEEIRVWIAGCSTGEEAYTHAIIFTECMENMEEKRRIKIFATDIDEDAIFYAGSGEYHESVAADIPPHYLAKYFNKKDGAYHISRHIREMVVFAKHNLIKDPPFTKIDLVSCRNLLIYFQPVLQKKALEMFSFSLNKGGILFLGTSESVGDNYENFEVLDNKNKIFRSRNRARRISTDQELLGPNDHIRPHRYRALPGFTNPAYSFYEDEKIYEQLLKFTSEVNQTAMIVVNDQMDIIHMFGEINNYLELPVGKMNNDITRLVIRELSIPVATAVQKAIKKDEEVHYSNIIVSNNGESKNIRMKVKQLINKKGQQPLVVIFIEKQTQKTLNGDIDGIKSYDVGKETAQRILDLEQELQFNKESLQATIEELETSNEELQATNEELLASNEELQSTNEELQSVNEELYTVNSELQDKIFELTELNNDLDNLLSSTEIGTIFLDDEFRIRKFTPRVANVLNIIDSDKGRSISDLTHRLKNIDLYAMVNTVYTDSKPIESEIQDTAGNWYYVRILPYQVAPSSYSGVVITFIEINEIKKVSSELSRHKKMYELTDKNIKVGHWDWDIKNDKITWINVDNVFGFAKGEFGGTLADFLSLIHPDDVSKVNHAIKTSIQTRQEYSVEHRIITKDNKTLWVHEYGQTLYEGDEPVRMMGVVKDITSEVNMSDELKDKLQFIETLNTAAPLVIGITSDRVINYINPYVEELTGYSPEELIGKKSLIMYPDEKEFLRVGEDKYNQIAEGGKGTVKTKWKCKNGDEIDVMVCSVPLDSDDLNKGIVFTAVPI